MSLGLTGTEVETDLLSTASLVLDKFSSLASDSANFCSKLSSFHLERTIEFSKIHSFYLFHSISQSILFFLRLANFNSSLNFLTIFIDLVSSLQIVSRALTRSTETIVSFYSNHHKYEQTDTYNYP